MTRQVIYKSLLYWVTALPDETVEDGLYGPYNSRKDADEARRGLERFDADFKREFPKWECKQVNEKPATTAMVRMLF